MSGDFTSHCMKCCRDIHTMFHHRLQVLITVTKITLYFALNFYDYTLCLKKGSPTFLAVIRGISDFHNFVKSVAEKWGNQKLVYFPTSPKQCFCTTWWNIKSLKYIFSVKHCVLLCGKTHKTHWNYHQVTFKLAYVHKRIIYVHQTRSESSKKLNRSSSDLLFRELAFIIYHGFNL